MEQISAIKHLYSYDDGDVIVPKMGVSTDSGYGYAQYINLDTGDITPNFEVHSPKFYPIAYSSKAGEIIVPASGGVWKYNNPEGSAITFGSDGISLAPYAGIFKQETITINNKSLPCLKVLKNLISLSDYTSKIIYYAGTYDGKAFTCDIQIPMQSTVGSAYSVVLNMVGENGVQGDNVLDANNTYVEVEAALNLAGSPILSGVSYSFQHLVDGVWTNIVAASGMYYYVNSKTLRIYAPAVEGVEIFRVAATYNTKTYYITFEVTDIHDPMYIYDGCSLAGDSLKRTENAVFTPVVYERATGTAQSGWTFTYEVTKKDGSGDVIDSGTGSTFTVTGATVHDNDGVSVRIEATKS